MVYYNITNYHKENLSHHFSFYRILTHAGMVKFVCLYVYLQFIVPLENFSLIWRRHHCRWRAADFDLCSALIAIEQWGFFNVPHWHGPTLFIMVISEDPWHSHLLTSIWRWSCQDLFLLLRSVATGNRTPISRMRGERSTSTPPRLCQVCGLSKS